MANNPFVTDVIPSSGFSRAQAGVGMYFTNTTGTTVTITQLGRWKINGNSQTHTVGIYTTNSFSAPAASVSVNMSGAPNDAFVLGTLSTPYDVAAGATIRIISSEGSGSGDYYLTQHSNGSGGYIANILTITDIGTVSAAFSNAGTGTITNGGNNGGSATAFGPVTFSYSAPVPSWTKNNGVYDTNGEYYQVTNAMNDSVSGEVVEVNADATWGIGGTYITVKAGVTLRGQGSGTTTITQASSFTQNSYGQGLIRLNSNSKVEGLEITGALSGFTTAFSIVLTTSRDWWVDDVVITPTAGKIILFYNNFATSQTGTTECRGLFSNCEITNLTTTESIYSRGLLDAWDSASGVGDENAIYIEDCVFNGPGYVCDANANAKIVVRNTTINGSMKIDGHGLYSNTPYQSCRRIEAYWNTFTYGGTGWSAFELRGGTNYIFLNTAVTTSAAFSLREYGILGNVSTQFYNTYQTPSNYPIGYQIGTGARTTINATAIVQYQMVRILTLNDGIGGANTDFTLIGSPNNTIGTQFLANGVTPTGTGTVTTTPATEPAYVFGNTVNGNPWARTVDTPHAGAISLYRTQTGNPSATFNENTGIIQSNRDVFSTAGFGSATGCTIGTAAQMAVATPTEKHGFWVTDEGSWNSQNNSVGTPGYQKGQGRLYIGNGSSWVLSYTPLTYPHPLRGTTPTTPEVTAIAINTTGTTLTLTLSEDCETGVGGIAGDVTLTASNGAVTWTYSSGDGTSSYVGTLSRTIVAGEVVTVDYAQPGNGIESVAAQVDLESFDDFPVTNNSTVTSPPANALRTPCASGGGF